MYSAQFEETHSETDEGQGTAMIAHRSRRKTTLFAVGMLLAVVGIAGFGIHSSPTATNSLKKVIGLSSASTAAPSPFSAMHPDPSVLTWLDPEEVRPGGINCGFMKVPLGSRTEYKDLYPDVKVYICIVFATTQPAPKGTLFGHCGGPGTLSDCGLGLNFGFVDQYNVVAIDQRGLGRSLPTFATPNCSLAALGLQGTGGISDQTSESQLRTALQEIKQRNFKCFQDPSFQLPAKKPAANPCSTSRRLLSTDSFNFLQFSGTTEVAEDLNRFRKAIGADKLSLHGASYGTQIAMTYATLFPEYTGKFILNSPMPPMPDSYKIGFDAAEGMEQVWDNLAQACDFAKSACPVTASSSGAALRAIMDKMRQLDFKVYLEPYQVAMLGPPWVPAIYVFNMLLGGGQQPDMAGVTKVFKKVQSLYELAQANNNTGFKDVVTKIGKDYIFGMTGPPPSRLLTPAANENPDTYYAPTTPDSVAGQPHYAALMGDMPGTAVLSQSTTGNALNENFFIARWKQVKETFPNLGLGKSAKMFAGWWGYTYAWPRATPIPSAASPTTPGIIVGFIYDPNTPYKWAQEAHQAFPMTSMVTSQASHHCIGQLPITSKKTYWLNECSKVLEAYLKDDVVPLDGTTCRSPVPLVV